MAFPSPATMVLSAAVWLSLVCGAVWGMDVYGTPLISSATKHYLDGTMLGARIDSIVILLRITLAIQTISIVLFIKRKFVGPAPYDFRNKHVLITGGSQGLGYCIALQCLQQGARVTIVARTESKLKAACEKLEEQAPVKGAFQVRYESADLCKCTAPQFRELLQRSAAAFGRVDVYFANAGFGQSMLVVDPDPSTNDLEHKDRYIQRVVGLNTLGTLRSVAAAADAMVQDGEGGRICIVSSAAGMVSTPGYAFYSATKFSHRGFVNGAHEDLLQRGVHVSCYFPGTIKTPGYAEEQKTIPVITQKLEEQCSDMASPQDCASSCLVGFKSWEKEITNELLFWMCTEHPTGNFVLDIIVVTLRRFILDVFGFYKQVMVSQYVGPKHSR